MYRKFGKRFLDVVISLLVLVVSLPVWVILILVLVVSNHGSIFFMQSRPGWHGQPFTLIKFKTMNDSRGGDGALLPDNIRLTRVGSIIRKLSLDELPQLVNVLKGEMSIVGPRPLLFKYMVLYSAEQSRRHEVRPGITGWAQVNGRNSITWGQKFSFDLYYVNNLSLFLDMHILAITVLKVLKREGINQSTERPMQTFDGSN